jgi:COP9 signalosome complex subunit 7
LKLRQLSLLTLAQDPKNLTYNNLITVLGLENGRELENLVISAIYAGLLNGNLDPYHQRVCISSVAPLRDVRPDSIPSLITTLKDWSSRCTSTLSSLEKQIATIKADALRRHKEERDWDAYVDKMIETDGDPSRKDDGRKLRGGKRAENMKRGLAGVNVDEGDMDVDEIEDEGEERRGTVTRLLKKRGLGGGATLGS